MNKFVQWALNITVGLFFFLFFLFLFFPLEEVARHYVGEVGRMSKGKYRIVIGKIEPSLLFKSSIKDLEVYTRDASGVEQVITKLADVKIGVSYLPLLAGKVSSSFIATSQKGKAEGDFSLSKDDSKVNVKIKDLSLDNFPYLSVLAKVPLKGSLSGTINIKYSAAEINKSEGKLDLSFLQFKIPAAHLMPVPSFELDLPETILSDTNGAQIKLSLKNSRLEIQDFSIPGPDLIVSLKGNIQINKRSNFSKLNLIGTFNFSDKIKEALPYLVIIENQKNEQGLYPLSISGRLTKPQMQIGNFDLTSLTGALPSGQGQ